jgi:hypothetical protein
LVLLLLLAVASSAQTRSKIGFQLRAYLAGADPSSSVDLFLHGGTADLARVVLMNGGRVKEAITGWVSASVPVERVRQLAADPAVKGITFSLSKGRTMNDSMRVKAHVNEVHAGLAPLPAAYQGDGVLVGIIDTGVDPAHPDFQDSLGHTRILRYWDQNFPFDAALTPEPFGYGQAWDSTAINSGNCPATDPLDQYGHGTTVAGTAAGNGLATGHHTGVAPHADLIVVANALNAPNWTATVVDAVRYIIDQATALGRPVAINISLGDYYGSHDGLDPAALMIDSMLTAAPGRVLVCAAGNSGSLPPYHLHTDVTPDTSFTWFAYNANSVLGGGAFYFDLWADSADFANVQYSVGADRHVGGYAYRGGIPFHSIGDAVDQIVVDTLWSSSGHDLGHVMMQAEQRGAQYHLEVYIPQPDSTSQLYYRFITTGIGAFDVWSSNSFGTSKIITEVPDAATFPPITAYVQPDMDMSIVDSWACSPQVITVGNYYNEQVYVDVAGNTQDLGGTEGAISVGSSHGPTRTGVIRPDVAAPGDITMSAGPLAFIASLIVTGPNKVDPDSLHMRNGGTSIASPVVAGTAALLLGKCPSATNVEVRDAINGSAFADSFTGALPNTQFGHGKINAFAALVSSNVPVPITGDTTVCAGDSVMLSGPASMNSYLWSIGSTEQAIWSVADTLTLSVISQEGCAGSSDTLIIASLPLPEATITMEGSTLTSSPASSYQWFLEGVPVPGADQQMWEAAVNGNYFVHVTDVQGCSANSDTVLVLGTNIPSTSVDRGLRVWPVPVVDALHVEGLGSGKGGWGFAVLDASGRTVERGKLAGTGQEIDVRHLSGGAYTLRLIGAGSGHDLRFVK